MTKPTHSFFARLEQQSQVPCILWDSEPLLKRFIRNCLIYDPLLRPISNRKHTPLDNQTGYRCVPDVSFNMHTTANCELHACEAHDSQLVDIVCKTDTE